MGEIKHTPGPWEIIPALPHEEIEGAFIAFASVEGADGMPVCVFGDGSGSGTMFENEADYRLIAAAPEMKEALEEALMALSMAEAEARRYAGFYEQGSDGRNTFVILADSIADRRSKLSGPAALAKANGERS